MSHANYVSTPITLIKIQEAIDVSEFVTGGMYSWQQIATNLHLLFPFQIKEGEILGLKGDKGKIMNTIAAYETTMEKRAEVLAFLRNITPDGFAVGVPNNNNNFRYNSECQWTYFYQIIWCKNIHLVTTLKLAFG